MKKIIFSSHADNKFEILKKHGVFISKEVIEDAVLSPDETMTGYKNRKISQKKLDGTHVLRVVYEIHNDDILIITLYPARSSRYEKS